MEWLLGHGQDIQKQHRHIQITERKRDIKEMRTVRQDELFQFAKMEENSAQFRHSFGEQECSKNNITQPPFVFWREQIKGKKYALKNDNKMEDVFDVMEHIKLFPEKMDSSLFHKKKLHPKHRLSHLFEKVNELAITR